MRDIAIVAGKLGVAKDDIIGFTEATDKLVVALGDELGNADEITTQLGLMDRDTPRLPSASAMALSDRLSFSRHKARIISLTAMALLPPGSSCWKNCARGRNPLEQYRYLP